MMPIRHALDEGMLAKIVVSDVPSVWAWLLVGLSCTQVVVVPIVARKENLGCGLWFILTCLETESVALTFRRMGLGFGFMAFVVPYLFGRNLGPLPLVGLALLAFAFAPLIVVATSKPRPDLDELLAREPGRRRRSRWRRRLRR